MRRGISDVLNEIDPMRGTLKYISPVMGVVVQIATNPKRGTVIHCNGVRRIEYAGIFTIFRRYLL